LGKTVEEPQTAVQFPCLTPRWQQLWVQKGKFPERPNGQGEANHKDFASAMPCKTLSKETDGGSRTDTGGGGHQQSNVKKPGGMKKMGVGETTQNLGGHYTAGSGHSEKPNREGGVGLDKAGLVVNKDFSRGRKTNLRPGNGG